MMARRGALGLLAGGVAALAGGCGAVRGRDELKFRLTLDVETPSRPARGSAILVNRRRKGAKALGQMDPGTSYVLGQAPYVDLGGGRYLFAVLNDPLYGRELKESVGSFMGYPDLKPPLSRRYQSWEWPEAFAEMKRVRPSAELKADDYPMLVTFADIADVATVEEVFPETMAAAFGPGTALKAIVLEVVDPDEDLTSGFEAEFPQIARAPSRLGHRPADASRTQYLDKKLRADCFVRRPE